MSESLIKLDALLPCKSNDILKNGKIRYYAKNMNLGTANCPGTVPQRERRSSYQKGKKNGKIR